MDGGSGGMTLAFELDALQQLAEPDAVFQDARRWSDYVGVVSAEPTYVITNFTRKHRIRQDFFSGPQDKRDTLEGVRDQFDTERYVYVGTGEEDRRLADDAGWEYLPVEDAAEAADWTLGEPDEAGAVAEGDHRDDWP
ncbi:MAG: hypothetical protein V5A23_03255 [Halobacteriales archaeon]